VKVINQLRHQEAQKPAPPLTKTEALLQEIRDVLARRSDAQG
jgi:large-conductance mechanosensitive channel